MLYAGAADKVSQPLDDLLADVTVGCIASPAAHLIESVHLHILSVASRAAR